LQVSNLSTKGTSGAERKHKRMTPLRKYYGFYSFGLFLSSVKGPALSDMKVTDKTCGDFGGSKACFPH